ncbi:pentapeptide repeat-containing protein [Flavobacterium pallidum]|uniref:Pentapeptide repeat-containing protein n=1 Tax=Flavobacterium pallidum TaxID=2172098 RepID=A0A2S1SI23_9FLAO|nr:pentapeptide repeat-containing protein [Flavobacterium pallidum]AWI25992.1 hypothetical protein HYN49_08820 [Flavobacterium pallidum]
MPSIQYVFETEFNNIKYEKNTADFTDFERCTFNDCDFSASAFVGVTFIDCVFQRCNFDTAKINYVSLRTAHFYQCSFREVNFAMCDKLIFDIRFADCILDFAKFYTLRLKGTTFSGCSLIAVDFMAADVTSCAFPDCNLYRAEFDKAIANKCDFSLSKNFTIDPSRTKLRKAVFSKHGLKGLLAKHEIIVS